MTTHNQYNTRLHATAAQQGTVIMAPSAEPAAEEIWGYQICGLKLANAIHR